jgi:hypothetical protein
LLFQGQSIMTTAAPVQTRHALGLPAGSVRALLAFGVLGYLWILAATMPDEANESLAQKQASQAFIYLQFLMVLILAHFFVAHGHTIGSAVSTRSPLGLPRGSVRLILVAGYFGLAYWMYTHQQLHQFQMPETGPVVLQLAILLGAFIVGHATTTLMRWFARGILPPWFQDVQAWFALVALFLLGFVVIVRLVINPTLQEGTKLTLQTTEPALAAFVGFYFGARS